jgi:hypothetical protein
MGFIMFKYCYIEKSNKQCKFLKTGVREDGVRIYECGHRKRKNNFKTVWSSYNKFYPPQNIAAPKWCPVFVLEREALLLVLIS